VYQLHFDLKKQLQKINLQQNEKVTSILFRVVFWVAVATQQNEHGWKSECASIAFWVALAAHPNEFESQSEITSITF
jgi:hypothetical protein